MRYPISHTFLNGRYFDEFGDNFFHKRRYVVRRKINESRIKELNGLQKFIFLILESLE